MSKNTIQEMLRGVQYQSANLASLIKDTQEAVDMLSALELSDTCTCLPSSRNWWITTESRDDVVKLMTLASSGEIWRKATQGGQITYSTLRDDGISITIYAKDNALPPTCKVIEVEETVPAYTRTVSKIVCNETA
jgi:hypothetical protein